MSNRPMFYDQVLWQAVEAVSRTFDVSPGAILSRKRTRKVADARKAVCLILRHKGLSLPSIGELIKRDPATILFAERGGKALLDIDKDFRQRFTLAKAMS